MRAWRHVNENVNENVNKKKSWFNPPTGFDPVTSG